MYIDKIWITGASGRLGSTLYRHLNPLDMEILATDKNIVDITNSKQVNKYVERNRPDIIINCSGLTKRNYCETHEDEAFLLNGLGARNIAVAARRVKAVLVHLSTEEVFDGTNLIPYREIDEPNPISVYGKSKNYGEKFVREFVPGHFIIRPSRLYSRENHFVEDIIEQAKKSKEVVVPKNQFFSPTSAIELTRFLLFLMNTSEYGTYHASCTGVCSRKEFAEEILKLTGIEAEIKEIEGDSQADFRPQYLALENYILNLTKEFEFLDWKKALSDYIDMEVKSAKK